MSRQTDMNEAFWGPDYVYVFTSQDTEDVNNLEVKVFADEEDAKAVFNKVWKDTEEEIVNDIDDMSLDAIYEENLIGLAKGEGGSLPWHAYVTEWGHLEFNLVKHKVQ